MRFNFRIIHFFIKQNEYGKVLILPQRHMIFPHKFERFPITFEPISDHDGKRIIPRGEVGRGGTEGNHPLNTQAERRAWTGVGRAIGYEIRREGRELGSRMLRSPIKACEIITSSWDFFLNNDFVLFSLLGVCF